MPDFSHWLGSRDKLDRTGRSESAWSRIQDNPTAVTLIRAGTALAAQTVRIEPYVTRTGAEMAGAAGRSGDQDVTIFGVRGHGTIANTDIRRDDRFAFEGKQYRVVHVTQYPNSIQALATALS